MSYIFGMTYVLITMLDQKFPQFLVGKPGKGYTDPSFGSIHIADREFNPH